MITQTLKRWLNKLFAWWPWGQSNRMSYSRAANSLNRGMTQELVWRTSVDGYVPQPGITSVVVEQGGDDTTSEIHQYSTDEGSEHISQSFQPTEVSPSSIPQNNGTQELPSSFSGDATQSSSDEEQHLTFLYYLVKRGVYNEGFTEGQEPEQYRYK